MYTQCPDCGTSFRVTAEVLKQAAGKVRCGGCGNAFNAVAYLSETKPEARRRPDVEESLPELTPDPFENEPDAPPPRRMTAAQSAALLKTLDQLAGEDIRIEDTGVEWRLMADDDDDDVSADAGAGAIEVVESFDDGEADPTDDDADAIFTDTRTPLDPLLLDADSSPGTVDEILNDSPTPVDEFLTESPNDIDAREVFADDGDAEIDDADVFEHPDTPAEDVLRFDDNTGLPDDFDLEALSAPAPLPPAEEPERFEEPMQLQADIAFGEPDEWGDLLSEVDPAGKARAESNEQAPDAAGPMTFVEELEALPDYDDDAEPGRESGLDGDDEPEGDDDAQPLSASDIDLSGIYDSPDSDDVLVSEAELADEDELALETSDEAEPAPSDADADDEPGPEPYAEDEIPDEDDIEDEDESLAAAADVPDDRAQIPADTSELQFQLDRARDVLNPDLEFDPTRTIVPPPTEEEQTVNMMIDEDLMRLALTDETGMTSTLVLQGKSSGADDDDAEVDGDIDEESRTFGKSSSSGGAGFETIIMEGAFARTEEEQRRLASEAAAHQKQIADAAQAELAAKTASARSRRMQYGIIAGVVVLALLLAGQFVHQSRAELATIPAVGETIGPLYRAVGAPITPEWDVTGWRFEVTRGSMSGGTAGDDGLAADAGAGPEVLTIYSRLGNQSDAPLPYPLLAVSLTDRFDDVLGSKVLEPADYLDEGVSAQGTIGPGESFEAVIAIDMPADEADGFKLNACYRKADGQLRCAIEDFR